MNEIEQLLEIKAEEMDRRQLPLATFRMIQALAANLIPQVRKNTINIKWLRWIVYVTTGAVLTIIVALIAKTFGG